MNALRSQLELATAPAPAPRPGLAAGSAVLERVPVAGGFAWAINPYGPACLQCPPHLARIGCAELHPGAPVARAQGVEVLLAQLRDVAARHDRSFAGQPVLLGTACDPWASAERDAHLTRRILEALAPLRGLELHCATRSSLVGRDADLLAHLARRGRVRVSVLLPGLARKTWMALEPHAPSPERRLMALGLLARAGVEVGVEAGPVLRGFNDADEGWLPLLGRAQQAGARFAVARPLELSELAREHLLATAEQVEPARAAQLRRLLIHAHLHDARSWAEAHRRFERLCAHLGLEALPGERRSEGAPAKPRQLSLF